MRNSVTIDKIEATNNQMINSLLNLGETSTELGRNNAIFRTLTNEEGDNFVNYITIIMMLKK